MKNIALLNDGRTVIYLPVNVYESISEFIIERLKEVKEISLPHLLEEALSTASIEFIGDPAWCFLQVKRDLEARGVIQVKIERKPAHIQSITLGRKRKKSTFFIL